jgi:kynurenine formamidase
MTMLSDIDIGSGSLRFAKDYVGVDDHNDGHTHIDAVCHVAHDGSIDNGRPQRAVTSAGAAFDAIDVLGDGLVGCAVLLDIPRLRDRPWLDSGEHIVRGRREAAEREQGITVGEGDILLVRTGHARRLAEFGAWETASATAPLRVVGGTGSRINPIAFL